MFRPGAFAYVASRMNTSRAILPREYGAYAELGFPLLTAVIGGGATAAGLAFALAVIAWFLVREPLAVLNGVRGARLEASLGRPARRAAVVLGAVGAIASAAGLRLAPPPARLAALVPGICAALLAPALLRGRPKTLGAEILVAFALSSMILPIGRAGTMEHAAAVGAAAVWAACFVLATLGVHAIKARAKPDLGAAWTRWATPVLALVIVAGGLLGAGVGALPTTIGLAVLPTALVVLAAGALGTHPRHLKRVGWSLVAANAVTLTLVLVG
jgi:hypothetical protein